MFYGHFAVHCVELGWRNKQADGHYQTHYLPATYYTVDNYTVCIKTIPMPIHPPVLLLVVEA